MQIGLTATPRQLIVGEKASAASQDEAKWRDNVRHFGDPVYEYTLSQGIEDGYLAPPEIFTFDLFHEHRTASSFASLRLCASHTSHPDTADNPLFHNSNTPNAMTENEISRIVVDAAVKLRQDLGPGLLESVYEVALAYLLMKRGLSCVRQFPVPISYDGLEFDEGFRADIVVNDLVILELKTVENIAPVHRKQLQTYLRLSDKKLGLLLNFGTPLMRDGIVRAVNNLPE